MVSNPRHQYSVTITQMFCDSADWIVMRYLATLSWICLAVVLVLAIMIYAGNWSHGDEGRVYVLLLAMAVVGGLGTLTGAPAALRWRRSTWIPAVANTGPVLFFVYLWILILKG